MFQHTLESLKTATFELPHVCFSTRMEGRECAWRKHSDRECLGNKLNLSSATPWRVESHDKCQVGKESCHVEMFFLSRNEQETCGSVSSFAVIAGFGTFLHLFLKKPRITQCNYGP
jgi:hypothetical protein